MIVLGIANILQVIYTGSEGCLYQVLGNTFLRNFDRMQEMNHYVFIIDTERSGFSFCFQCSDTGTSILYILKNLENI